MGTSDKLIIFLHLTGWFLRNSFNINSKRRLKVEKEECLVSLFVVQSNLTLIHSIKQKPCK